MWRRGGSSAHTRTGPHEKTCDMRGSLVPGSSSLSVVSPRRFAAGDRGGFRVFCCRAGPPRNGMCDVASSCGTSTRPRRDAGLSRCVNIKSHVEIRRRCFAVGRVVPHDVCMPAAGYPGAARGLVRGAAAGRVCRGCGGGAGGRDGPRAARLDRTAMRRMPLAGRCRCAGGRPPSAGLAATVDAAIGFEYCMRILNEQQVGVPIRRETESDLYRLYTCSPRRTRRGTDGTVNTIREATRILRYLPALT